jgi:hypothetical protein
MDVVNVAHTHHEAEEKDYPSLMKKARLLVVSSGVVVAVKEWRMRAEPADTMF